MKHTSSLCSVLLALALSSADAFTVASVRPITGAASSSSSLQAAAAAPDGRRSFLTTAVTAATLLTAAYPAVAEVSSGTSLPDGAAQFARVLRLKTDLEAVAKRVRSNADEIDKKEWESISVFLRKIYSAGDDMKFITKTIPDPTKQKRSAEIVKAVQKLAVAGDLPAQNNDAVNYLIISDKVALLVDEFFALLQDVPDEI